MTISFTPLRTSIGAIALAALVACGGLPLSNARLDQARRDLSTAQANSQTQTLAPVELKQAGDAFALADAAFVRGDDASKVDQLAYLASQRIALAQQTGERKASELVVRDAGAERDRARLQARTREAEVATQSANAANRAATSATRDAEFAQQQAALSQQQAASAQWQAGEAERRSAVLEATLRELDAKKTERGIVVTFGDVLFDTGMSQLKPGGRQQIERLGGFMQSHPQLNALVEGYTDSVGNSGANQNLSERRAESVVAVLIGAGASRSQLTSTGFGETHPVAGNDSASGRQLNRRVEVVLSDETGKLPAR